MGKKRITWSLRGRKPKRRVRGVCVHVCACVHVYVTHAPCGMPMHMTVYVCAHAYACVVVCMEIEQCVCVCVWKISKSDPDH